MGCRLPDCEVTLALLDLLDAPLMCSTVPFDGDVQPIVMRDEYSRCAFVLDAGHDAEQLASTVIDLFYRRGAKVLRVGAGDASVWSEDGDVHVEVDDPDLAWGLHNIPETRVLLFVINFVISRHNTFKRFACTSF